MTDLTRRNILVAAGAATAATAVTVGVGLSGGEWPWPTRGRGRRTSFGSVAVLASTRIALAPSAEGVANTHRHVAADTPVPSMVHGAWTDAVVVDVAVHNGTRHPMALSPGQFRVRLDEDGPTVTLYSSDRRPGPVEAGSTTAMRISYLVPPRGPAVSLEFVDAAAATTHRLGALDAGAAS